MLKALAIFFLKGSLDSFTGFGLVTCIGDEIILFWEDESVSSGWIYDVLRLWSWNRWCWLFGFWLNFPFGSELLRKEWKNNGQRLMVAVGSGKKTRQYVRQRGFFFLTSLQFLCLCFLQENPAQFTGSEFSSSDRDVHLQPPSAGTLRFQKRLSTPQDR